MTWKDLWGFPAHVVAQRIDTDPKLHPWREELVQEMVTHLWHLFHSGKVNPTMRPEQIRSYVYRGLKMRLSREIEKLKVRTDHDSLEGEYDGQYELGECDLSMSDVRMDVKKVTERLYSDELQVLAETFGEAVPPGETRGAKNRRYEKRDRLLSIIREQIND